LPRSFKCDQDFVGAAESVKEPLGGENVKNVNDTPIVKRETPRFEDGRPLVLQSSLNDTAKILIHGSE